MSRWTLLLRTLLYHWRTNVAVGLGVVAGTAVIGGALIVGDSVHGSLRSMTLARLGPIDFALTGPRFIREQLADELPPSGDAPSGGPGKLDSSLPAILLQGSFERRPRGEATAITRSGRVHVIALGPTAWSAINPELSPPQGLDVALNNRLALALHAKVGDEVTLQVELPHDIPRDALLGKRDETAIEIPLKVSTVLADDAPGSRFGLRPDQQLPLNALVALQMLQDRLGLAGHVPTPRDSRSLPPRVNTLLVSAAGEDAVTDPDRARSLDRLLQRHWKLDDFHARIVANERFGYLSLETERMILERPIADAARRVAERLGCRVSPVLASIANEISVVGRKINPDKSDKAPAYSRYSVVVGLDPQTFAVDAGPPFGPFRFQLPEIPPALGDGKIEQPDGSGEIVINDWLAKDLRAKVGDVVRVTYHVVGSHGELPEEERHFKVRGIVRLDGTVAGDRGLVPEVRGITDVTSLADWDAPFPMLPVTARDDEYWKEYRATPKAFVTLNAAQHLWRSRYGDLTSFRITPVPGKSLEESQQVLSDALLQELTPAEVGLSFQPVKYLGLKASSGSTDFGGLFIGFSFFLILSATILIGLLFRLGIDRRAANVGLLLATGFSPAQVRTLLLAEGGLVVAAGGAAGALAAVGYAGLIVYGLKTWWIGAIGTRFLELHVEPASLTIGLVIATGVALGSVWWSVRGLWKLPPRRLLAGVTVPAQHVEQQRARGGRTLRRAHVLTALAAAATAVVVLHLVPDREAFAGFSWPTVIFFLVGMNALVAGMFYLSAWVDSDRTAAVRGSGLSGMIQLGVRNAARHRARSVLSTGLIASATFLIIAIAAGHRNPAVEAPDKNSGNGGFTVVAESTIPVLYDLNTPAGRRKLDLDDKDATAALGAMKKAVAFRVNPGENASCLNIYQTSQPTILGVPPDMIDRGGFKFVGAAEENPWKRLSEPEQDDAILVFGDMNTLQYSLHVGPGATLDIRAENGEMAKVKIAGMLDSSVFQGVLLMDERAFLKLFPSRAGYQYFLIEVPPASAKEVEDVLESKLVGFDAERVADRLASYLAVQNTYLSTFQALGGLGLLLGTIGLATVMLRNVLERRAELALFRAIGFRDALLAGLVLAENALLLAWGLATGSGSALLAMLPHMLSTGADVPWGDVAIILVAVFLAGMLGALLAIRSALRTPVLATLRAE